MPQGLHPTASAGTALTGGISFIPQLLGGSLLGAIADRVPARQLITVGYTMEFGTALLLALVDVPVWLSLTLVAAVAAVTPVFNGAGSRLVAQVLTGDSYVLGRSLTTLANSAAQLLGLAGGGVAIAALGGRHAMLVSAFVHLTAAVWVRLRLPLLPLRTDRAVGTFRQSWVGNRKLLADRTIRTLILAQWLPPAFVTGAEGLLVPYASARGLPPTTGGLLLACVPVGMMAGSFLVGRHVEPVVRERLSVPLLVVLGLPLAGFAVDLPTVLAGVLLIVTGLGFAYELGLQRRFLDALPEDGRGQAFSLLSTGLMTAQGVSPALAGALAGVIPIGGVIALSGAATMLAAGVFRRALGDLDRSG